MAFDAISNLEIWKENLVIYQKAFLQAPLPLLGIHVIVVKIDTNLGNLPLSYNNNRLWVVPTVGKRPMSQGNTQDECSLSHAWLSYSSTKGVLTLYYMNINRWIVLKLIESWLAHLFCQCLWPLSFRYNFALPVVYSYFSCLIFSKILYINFIL